MDRRIAVIALALTLIMAGVLALSRSPEPAEPDTSSGEFPIKRSQGKDTGKHTPIDVQPTNSPVRAQTSLVNSKSVDVTRPTQRWLNSLKQGLGDRQFILAARDSPGDGGYLYAGYAVDVCASASAALDLSSVHAPTLSASHPNFVSVQQFLQQLKAQCSQLTSDEIRSFSTSAVVRSAQSSPDTLVEQIRRFTHAVDNRDVGARHRALQSIIETSDPLVLEALGARIAMTSKEGAAAISLGGAIELVRNNPPELDAFYLLPCEFGLPCDIRDPQIGIACITGSECYRDRYEKLLNGVYGGDTVRYQQTLQIVHLIVSRIRAGDADFFVPK